MQFSRISRPIAAYRAALRTEVRGGRTEPCARDAISLKTGAENKCLDRALSERSRRSRTSCDGELL